MKKLIFILAVLFLSRESTAQAPSWTVNPADYSNSMVLVGVIKIDGVESIDTNDRIAAFFGSEVRGVGSVQYEAAIDRYVVYLIAYANQSGIDLSFKLYDADGGVIVDAFNTVSFQIDGQQGNLERPLVWSNVALNSGDEITSFGFNQSIGTSTISAATINADVAFGTDLTTLVANFTNSLNARVTVDNTLQTSGTTSNDFTNGVSYRVNSEDGQSSRTYTVNVSILNLEPTDILLDVNSVAENQVTGSLVGTLSAADDDAAHTFTLVSGTGDTDNGLFIIDGDQLLTNAVFDFESKSSYAIRVKVTDLEGQTFDKALTIQINDVNEAPVVANQSFILGENSPVGQAVGTVSATDPESDALSFALSGSAAFGINATSGVISVVDSTLLDYELTPQITMTLSVSDGSLQTNATLTVDLIDIFEAGNGAPLIQDHTFYVRENSTNQSVVGTISAIDPQSDALTFALAGSSAFSITNAGVLSVLDSAQLDFETTSSFAMTVTVSDGQLSSSANITVIVIDIAEPVNQTPVIAPQTLYVLENSTNGSTVGTINASDADSDVLSYTLASNTVFTINASTGVITVLDGSLLDFETTTSYSLEVGVSDGTASATATLTIEVVDVNEAQNINRAPLVSDQTFYIQENSALGTVVGTITALDPESDALTYGLSGSTAFSIDIQGKLSVADSSQLDYEVNPEFTLTVSVSDGALSTDATLTVRLSDVDETVTPPPANNTPVVSNQTLYVLENSTNGSTVGTINASDADGDVLSYTLASNTVLTINASTGVITVLDGSLLDFETTTSYSLEVGVSDGTASATATLTIEVVDVNETQVVNQAPLVSDQTFYLPENSALGTVVGTITTLDPESDALTYGLSGSTAFSIDTQGKLSVADSSQLDYEVNPEFTLTVSVSDGALSTDATLTVRLSDVDETVTPPPANNTPVVLAQTLYVLENSTNGSTVGTVNASDADGDVLVYVLMDSSGTFKIESNSGLVTVLDSTLLDFETNPVFVFNVSVSDGSLTDTATLTVRLIDVFESSNQAPRINDQIFYLAEKSSAGNSVGLVNASDPDGDVLTFSLTDTTGTFSINSSTGLLSVLDSTLLNHAVNPVFQMEVTVSDGQLTSTAVLTVNLTPVGGGNTGNQAPNIAGQTLYLPENSPIGFEVGVVNASDPDGDTLVYALMDSSGIFKIESSSGLVTVLNSTLLDFETNPVFVFNVAVSDGSLSDTATLTVNLTDVFESSNQAPRINDQIFYLAEKSAVGIAVGLVNASDPDGDVLTFSLTDTTGTFSINNSTGLLSVFDSTLLNHAVNPVFQIEVTASDGQLSSTAVLTVNLTPVGGGNTGNQAPNIAGQTLYLPENSPVGFEVGVVNASDPDKDSLIYVLTDSSGAFAINRTTGLLTVKNATPLDFETNPSFDLSVTVTDGSLSASAPIKVILSDVTEAVNQSPLLSSQVFSVPENSMIGFELGIVTVTDPDGDALLFSISSDSSGSFAIDITSGMLSVIDSTLLDYETSKLLVIEISVSDGEFTVMASMTVLITDVEENTAPQMDSTMQFSIAENAAAGTLVEVISAIDNEGDVLHYSITSGNDDLVFELDTLNGRLKVRNMELLNFELKSSHDLTIAVSDGILVSESSVNISISDVNENPTAINLSASSISENVEAGRIGDFTTEDPDANESFSYALLTQTDLFEILEGTLRTKGPMDFEESSSYTLTVQSKDQGGLSIIESFLITISDVEEIVLGQIPAVKLNVYPNPAIDYISVNADSGFDKIICYDLSGVKLLEATSDHLDVSGLDKGAYLLRIFMGEDIQTLKFIKK